MHFRSHLTVLREPWFSYTVTRPYPFKWFTPVVISGGLIAVIVFSVLNFAGNAYQMETVVTTNPNSTVRHYDWMTRPPWSWTMKEQATCQPESIPLGTKIFTTNYGLTYTLTKVVPESNRSLILPALPYLNNDIHRCSVVGMNVQLPPSNELGLSNLFQYSLANSGNAKARVLCSIPTHNGTLAATLEFNFKTHETDDQRLVQLPRPNPTSDNIIVGAILVEAYWNLLTRRMSLAMPWNDTSGPIYKASHMHLSLDQHGSFSNHSKLKFLYEWIQSDRIALTSYDPNVLGPGPYKDTKLHNLGSLYNTGARLVRIKGQHATTFPDIWNEAEGFGSGLYSLIMADLGQRQSTILQNATLLKRYLWASDNNHNTSVTFMRRTYINSGWETNTTFFELSNQINQSSLVTPRSSRIYYQYACLVPVRRGMFQIIVGIAVADYVMVTVLWHILSSIVNRYITRKDPHANWCEGCSMKSEPPKCLPAPVTSGATQLSSDTQSIQEDPIAQESDLAAAYKWDDPGSVQVDALPATTQVEPKGSKSWFDRVRNHTG